MQCIHLLDTDGFAGTERHVLTLVQRLRGQGIEAVIGCRTGAALHHAAVAAGVPVIPMGHRPGPRMLVALLRQVRRRGPELIHAHNGRTQLMGAVVNRLTGVPLFATQHFLDPQFTTYRGAKRAVANAAHAWVNRSVSRFAAVSEAARRAMLRREHLEEDRVVTIPNGIDPLTMPPTERLIQLRRELGLPLDVPLVVTVARLVMEKGLSDLIDAVAIVKKTLPEVWLVIVGEGALRGELDDRAKRLGVGDRIRFAGFRADATDIIAIADLFVLPSPAEPFGLVLLEAMALGRPVVATAAGGPLEIVVEGETGRLVLPSDPVTLAAAIVSVLRDPQRGMFGAAGRARLERHFTADRMAVATASMYADRLRTAPEVVAVP